MASPAFLSYKTGSSSTGAALTISRPAGLASGDVMLAVVHDSPGAIASGPSGWTEVLDESGMKVYRRTAGGSEPTSYAWYRSGATGAIVGGICAFRGGVVDVSSVDSGTATSMIAPTVTTPTDAALVFGFAVTDTTATATTPSVPSGMTDIGTATGGSGSYALRMRFAYLDVPTAGATGTKDFGTAAASNDWYAGLVVVKSDNTLPNAPTLSSPTGNAVLDRANATVLRWTHSDPDGDTQADAEVRYKEVGGSWTTVTSKGTATSHSIIGSTLAAGAWEWQARTSDAEDFGPWSSSAYFTLADQPAAPGITAPTSGATIPDGEEDVTLTHADSPDFVEVEVVATDGTTIVTDTGAIAWTTTVSDIGFPVEVNGTTVTLRARVKKDGLWSAWTSQSHPVSYTAPATPTITVASLTDGGVPVAIRVSHSNPTPSGSEPDVATVEVYRRLGGATDAGIRIATVDPDADFDDYLVASDVDYEYRVIAWSADSIASASAWEDEITVTAEVVDEDPFIEGEAP